MHPRDEAIAIASFIAVVVLVAFAIGLSGCAGHEAMIWRQPVPYVEQCKVPVCEKINPRDKHCWREYCAG
jgi:hypothetical protein